MTVCVRGDTTEKDFNMSVQVRIVSVTCMQSLGFTFKFKSFEEMD